MGDYHKSSNKHPEHCFVCNFSGLSGMYTASQKNSQNCFRQNFVKFPLTLIIFGRKMAKTMKLCEVHLFSTSPNLCQRTTM